MRRFLLNSVDINNTAEQLATEGLIDLRDLWWLCERHRVMVPAGTWALVLMWADLLPDDVVDLMGDPGWWNWYDRGISDVRRGYDPPPEAPSETS